MIGLCRTMTGYFFNLSGKNNKGHFYPISFITTIFVLI